MLAFRTSPPLSPDAGDTLASIAIELGGLDRLAAARRLEVGAGLLADASRLAAEAGATEITLEVEPAGRVHDELAATSGFSLSRDLWQVRRPLPIEEHTDLEVRPFRPGQDEMAWLEVNNRAFTWHPEQSDWSVADMRTRETEPWFDPEGFLLHERDGRLAGFCWTKVHRETDPVLGEIYVIAVDPSFHGLGLGRGLLVAGLEWLGAQGVAVAMLYVESGNTTALSLYRSLGFEWHSGHRWYTARLT